MIPDAERRVVSVLCFLLCCVAGSASRADDACPAAGRLVSVEGSVEVSHSQQASWLAGQLGQSLCEGDTIRVGEASRAAVQLINDAVLRLDQSTTIRLLDISAKKEEKSLLQLVAGALKSFSRSPRQMAVNTPYVNGMIEGTEFAMRVEGNQTQVSVFEGKVSTVNRFGKLTLTPGKTAVAQAGQPPRPYTLVRPQDTVQWTLYYPPIFAVAGGRSQIPASVGPLLRPAWSLATRGDTAGALGLLETLPTSRRDAQFQAYRASLLLNVGRVTEARAAIENALTQDPKAGLAYALRAIIHIVQNERDAALGDALKAVVLSPDPAAKIALSYAQQAKQQIEAARDTMLSAVKTSPGDALAWARLGELWLMVGERRKALAAAGKALELAPDLARTQLVLGYAALAEFRNRDARQAFQRAVELNPADPLAHLGLGLAIISDGGISEGRAELEIATGLDSSNALLRAYLGKAYFDERRYPLDSQQYDIAKSLDPNDPTAYLYDGILKQTVNRPVEALHDIQTAIEKNDNRAAYRSRLLLDQDRAARGTSIGRVYNDLGFREIGVIEAGRSLTLDPTSDSAHRFLSDIYRLVPRRETARVSDLLQAQLLQDININPVQPSLADTNLNIITRGGASDPGFNEFTPIFERNTARLYSTGVFGNQKTIGGEGVVTAIYDRYSFSAGAFDYSTDGWRPNGDISHNIYNAYGQVAVTPELNVQGEYNHRETHYGDLEFAFLPSSYQPNARRKLNQDMARFGAHYSTGPQSDWLLSYIHGARSQRQTNSVFNEDARGTANETADQIEAMHIFRHDWFNVLTGFGYNRVSQNIGFGFADSGVTALTSDIPSVIDDYRGYLYANVNYPSPVTWTVGMSVVSFQQNGTLTTNFPSIGFGQTVPLKADFNKVNPKFGVQWNVTEDLLFRGFYTQVVKQALVANRTLEPTQVGTFDQFFDDANATQYQRYGLGLNWQASRDLTIGAEATWRDLQEPNINAEASAAVLLHDDAREALHQFYLYWTALDRVAVRAAAVYDDYNKVSDDFSIFAGSTLPLQVSTFSVPISASYFDPSGIFAYAGSSYVNQNVERLAELPNQGHDQFFVVDVGLGFRFPKRLGIASFQILNLLDQEFNYQDNTYRTFSDEPAVGPYFPDRTLFGRITFNFGP